MKIVSFQKSNKELFEQAITIRRIVFINEMNVSEADEFEFDENATHYLVLKDKQAVATSRWRITDEGIKLERFAVLKSHRSKGYGRLILKQMLEDAIQQNKYIYLYAQIEAVNFYQKNGFTTRGDQFMEAGIKHIMMEYNYS